MKHPAFRLTDAVHLSHFEDKTLKVLRSPSERIHPGGLHVFASHLADSADTEEKRSLQSSFARGKLFLKKERAFFSSVFCLQVFGRWRGLQKSETKNVIATYYKAKKFLISFFTSFNRLSEILPLRVRIRLCETILIW